MITIDPRNALQKRVKIRATGADGRSFEVTIPREVVMREARKLRIPPEEVAKKLRAVWHYDHFKGLHLELIYTEAGGEVE
jgi:hypothetical protein